MKALQSLGFEGRGAVLTPPFSASNSVIHPGESAFCMTKSNSGSLARREPPFAPCSCHSTQKTYRKHRVFCFIRHHEHCFLITLRSCGERASWGSLNHRHSTQKTGQLRSRKLGKCCLTQKRHPLIVSFETENTVVWLRRKGLAIVNWNRIYCCLRQKIDAQALVFTGFQLG